ncbi:hyalin-like [Antedon mediterranea]|uniref:hyalin-like n=1 Tax=Antedon mediterranea TaxID=105859 RepID=UPI003AF5C650
MYDREPDLICPEHITVGNNTDQYEDPVTWSDPTVTDNLHKDISATCTPELGSIFDVGSTIVTCSATDDIGNVGSCSFVVHVIGQTFISYNKEPDLVCPEPIIVNNSTDQYEYPVTWKNPIVTDNLLNDISATCTPASGSIFDVGSTIVTCSATDGTGNVGSCSFVVHVMDQTYLSGYSDEGHEFISASGQVAILVVLCILVANLVLALIVVVRYYKWKWKYKQDTFTVRKKKEDDAIYCSVLQP